MTILQAIILGIIQGITEFLPISSSGHLVLAPYFFGWETASKQAFLFDVLVQVATLAAVFVYFWSDLKAITKATWQGVLETQPFGDPQARLGWYLLLATLPAIFFGLLLRDSIEDTFTNPLTTAILLFGTAILLVIAEQVGRRTRSMEALDWKDSLWIGFFQVLALYPGISRSGATIAGGMTRNLNRPASARFAFLMSVPVMIAAGVVATINLIQAPAGEISLLPILVGCLTAGIVGYLAIRWLLAYLASRSLYVFAAYCTLIGCLTILVIFLRG